MTILDTLTIARDLRNAGFSEQQANALVDVVRVAAGIPDIQLLATKAELQAEIANVKAEIANAKHDILKWVFAMIVVALLINIGTMIALIQFLPHKQ